MIQKLSETGVAGLVLFNRFYSPDIDIDKMEVVSSSVFSAPSELPISLRWIAIMAERVKCDLAASTGVHDGNALIKQILAGADAVQIASTLYKNGKGQIGEMLKTLEEWMAKQDFSKLADFKGKMSQAKSSNPAAYERVQFMKYFGGVN
jgi:dihydroorotate dehydrogenase (fumarate)